MAISVVCPNGHPVLVKDEYAGKTGFCPQCHAKVQVPLPKAADDLPALDEFVRQALDTNWVAGETASNPPPSLFPLKKKAKLCVECGSVLSRSFTVCPRCATPVSNYRHLQVRKEGDVFVVGFVEHQIRDESIIGELADELCSVADRAPKQRLVLDFSGVSGVSGTMVGKLVMLQARIKKTRGDLRPRKVGPGVRQVLAAMSLDRTFEIEEDEWHLSQGHA